MSTICSFFTYTEGKPCYCDNNVDISMFDAVLNNNKRLAFWLIYKDGIQKSHSSSGWAEHFHVFKAELMQMLSVHL